VIIQHKKSQISRFAETDWLLTSRAAAGGWLSALPLAAIPIDG
jgi:hypothetical protein